MPGKDFPSNQAKNAPPAVDKYEKFSAQPAARNAETVSPPPATDTNFPELVLLATTNAALFVALSYGFVSNAPKGSKQQLSVFLKKHSVALQQIAGDAKKTQRFETWLAKWNEGIDEAPKPKMPKTRNPVASHAQSSGSGVHADQNKKKRPDRKDKHKKQLNFEAESIKEMLYRKLNAKK